MKRQHTHRKRTSKRLALHRETLRRLSPGEVQQAAGGDGPTRWFTCSRTTTRRWDDIDREE